MRRLTEFDFEKLSEEEQKEIRVKVLDNILILFCEGYSITLATNKTANDLKLHSLLVEKIKREDENMQLILKKIKTRLRGFYK